jgi:Zinc dependent phospholipase C
LAAWAGIVLLLTQACAAYSVLTHEEVVDLLWESNLQPILKHRFPDADDKQLREAHAYAYGGSLIQDMGYYPFGSRYFSDLTHYVRSGDFVLSMLRNAQTLDEYAFALGALSHYVSDNTGHPMVNHVVALEFPKLQKKFGDQVTYSDSPKAHIRTEFGFDMTQVAKNRYTSDRYHDFIGFEVSQALLGKSFEETYGIKLSDVIPNEELAIGSFRRAVGTIIPEMTRVALLSQKKEAVRDSPNAAEKQFRYYLSRTDYEHEWGTVYRHPGFGTRVLAFFLKLVPKKGPFSGLDFKIPTTQAEDQYVKSVDLTVEGYTKLLNDYSHDTLQLPNRNFDTGKDTLAGEYKLSDTTYARLLDQLAQHQSSSVPDELRANIVAFYSSGSAAKVAKNTGKSWKKAQDELQLLRAQPTVGSLPTSGSG